MSVQYVRLGSYKKISKRGISSPLFLTVWHFFRWPFQAIPGWLDAILKTSEPF